MKGQAAIEYLATYGWMLAAVAMVSGVIYSSTGASFCNSQVSGFSLYSAQVQDFGLTADRPTLQLDIQNNDPQGYTQNLTRVVLQDRDEETSQRTLSLDRTLQPGQSQVVEVSGVESSDACNTMDVTLVYDRGDVLPNQKARGSITASAEIVESTEIGPNFQTDITSVDTAPAGEESTIYYQIENTGGEGTQDISLTVDGTEVNSETLTLSSYETVTRTYSQTFTDSQEYNLQLSSSNGSETGTINIQEPPAEISLQNLNAPSEAAVGGSIDVSAEAVSSEGSTTSTAELQIDGNTEETQTVTVNDGETQPISFTDVSLAGYSSGNHEVSVLFDGETLTQTVTLVEEPVIERVVVQDSTAGGDVVYDVEYEVGNTANFQEARIEFDNLGGSNEWADQTETSTDSPIGTVNYDQFPGDNQVYNITVDLIDDNGDTSNSVTLNDEADGQNTFYPSDLGTGPNTPNLESYDIIDSTSDTGSTQFDVSYTVNNTENYDQTQVVFNNLENDWSDETFTSTQTSDSFTYDRWTGGDTYNITIDVYSTDGIVVDSQTTEVTANGEDPGSGGGSQPSITDFTVTDESRCTGGNSCNGQNEASYQVDWSASDPNNNLDAANVTINGNVPGGNWEGISGSDTYTQNGEHGTDYTIRFQASYSSGEYLCQEVTDTAQEGSGISGSYTDCS